MSYKTKIDEVLSDFFPEPNFKIEQLEAEYENTFRYQIISDIEGKRFNCIFVQFFEDHIYIERLGRCELKGSETLKIIEQIAKQLENISYISLEDDSTLKVFPAIDIWINLYIYKILTKGQSWYNSLGYYSDNYANEFIENKKFENMTIKEFQEDVKSRIINYSKYDIHLKIFPDIFSVKPEESMTVPEFYNEIMNHFVEMNQMRKKLKWLEDDLNFVLDSGIIIYNPIILKKRIREPRGGARGKKHRKSRKKRKFSC
jgi:hypothetical protein